jgi:hypothetical protein
MAQVNYLGLFPWCPTVTNDRSLLGDKTYYPVGFTESEMAAIYWKIKSWKVTVHSIATENAPPSSACPHGFSNSVDATGSIQLMIGGQTPLTSESQLVCQTAPYFTINGSYPAHPTTTTNNCDGTTTHPDAGFLIGNTYMGSSVYYYDGRYFPSIQIYGGVAPWWQFNPVSVSGLTFTSSCTISSPFFSTQTINIYNLWSPSNSNLPSYSATSTQLVTIEADSYWPYNP